MTAFSETAGARLARGVRRYFAERGEAALLEFVPAAGLRVDVIALAPDGGLTVVECKASVADFRADTKWPGYLDWCDRFLFAVDDDFPLELLPEAHGIIRADAWSAELIRPAETRRLAPARRRAMLLRFAQTAAERLRRAEDPGAAGFALPAEAGAA